MATTPTFLPFNKSKYSAVWLAATIILTSSFTSVKFAISVFFSLFGLALAGN
ncbi:hypothetical protein OEG92_18110 [Polaribacter sejongensis]|uniref:hypothetical protein n=1 Tax=Polaribacter sejongensis TaxID=985043 RepID=UPI0035A6CAD1